MTARLVSILCFATVIFAHNYGMAQGKKIRIAIPGYTITSAPFLVAHLNGYYTKEGLEEEIISMRAPTANLAVLAGNVEFSTVPTVGLVSALRGAPLKLVFSAFDKPQHSLFTKPEVQNLTMLRGKSVAVSGIAAVDDVLLKELLSAHGVDASRAITILAIGNADTRFGALVSRTIDATTLISPLTFKAKDMGFRELVSFAEHNFIMPGGGVIVREQLLKTDPSLVERFLRASLMGLLFLRENRADSIRLLAQALKVDEPLAARIYEATRPTMTVDGDLSLDAQRQVIRLISKMAEVKDAPNPDKLFDFSLLRQSRSALKATGWRPGP